MKIKVHQNAAANYVTRCYRGAPHRCAQLHRPEWVAQLEKVQGQWVEVETNWLFANQFNTAPTPECPQGLRLMGEDTEGVKDDIRIGRVFDEFTHKNYAIDEIPEVCKGEERKKYLKKFAPHTREGINPAHLQLVKFEF